ncbi:cathepsin B-like [Brevipalpus obovatus]|uniref:cathepsin B-like n=1 Tax=Brevipalpus obovatus TaxID=246614 RepID=UPI003D9F15C9
MAPKKISDHFKQDHTKNFSRIEKTKTKPKLPMKSVEIVKNIPDSFDARTQWPECPSIGLIRDESNCGACWAFGAVGAISDRICIASGGKKKVNISAEDLVACANLGGCNGDFSASAWQYWVKSGIVTGDLYEGGGCMPYTIEPGHQGEPYLPAPKCKLFCQGGYMKTYAEDKQFGVSAYSISPDVKAIQSEIMRNGPVEASFQLFLDFTYYRSGVYEGGDKFALRNHAVKLLGWGTEDGIPYWLGANSWNKTWGDKGFFKFRRGTNLCGIEANVYAGIPKP